MSVIFSQIDNNWTLFLDRDGVLNKRPPGDYVKNWKEFEFLPGVIEALKICASKFQKIIIITNQQGIGKNIMAVEDLHLIHSQLKDEVLKNGGRIDAIYFCPDLSTKPNNCRKPSDRMAQQAKKDFPDLDFSRSIMAGDTLTDLQFGQRSGMKTVYINTNDDKLPDTSYDLCFNSLIGFAIAVCEND